MSVIAHRNNVEIPTTVGQADRTTIASSVSAIVTSCESIAQDFSRTLQAVAEARMHKAAIEVELYRNRYKHSSKNDDDLPIVR